MNSLIDRVKLNTKRPDPLRRWMPTQLLADLTVMGRAIRFETNSPSLLKLTQDLFARYPRASHGFSEFRWRIVCEPNLQVRPPWPEMCAFSDEGLRFVSIGQHGFLAIDLAAREAVGYLGEGLLADPGGFSSPFLNTLFAMTAGALRLTPLAGACVTMGVKALLVLGKPNNGKTTSSYLAGRLGLEFYSDQSMFLDLDDAGLRLWGDFSPAAFRAEISEFHPKLQVVGRPFQYRDLKFLYVEEGTSIPSNGHPVIPVACVFLERGVASTPRLTQLTYSQTCQRQEESLSFRDDERFESQRSAALSALAKLPAYHLAYGDDPAVAATFLRNILTVHCSLEVAR